MNMITEIVVVTSLTTWLLELCLTLLFRMIPWIRRSRITKGEIATTIVLK